MLHLTVLLDQVVQLLSQLFLPELVHLEVEQEIKLCMKSGHITFNVAIVNRYTVARRFCC